MDETKLNVKKTMYFSFGFFAVSLAWALYNAYVPIILRGEHFNLNNTQVGFIMVIDNLAAVILEPTFGHLSDRTRTRFGRRMPYIYVGIPAAAAAFIVLPFMYHLWSLMPVLILFCVIMATWRTPVISLMPDLTPGPLRSQANGIVNLFGGLGALLAFAGGGLLRKAGGYPLVFLTGAFVMLLALVVLMAKVREPQQAYAVDEPPPRVRLTPAERKSLLLILFAIFFWFVGYSPVETYFTLFATRTLGMSESNAPILLGVFSIALIAFAVPAGFLGARFGRRKLIMIGLVGVVVMFLPMILGAGVTVTAACLFGGGLFWACININSLPMVVRVGGERLFGTFVGYYYLFSVSAQIVAPPSVGRLIDLAGDNYRVLFVFSCVGFVLALAVLLFVRHGEDTAPETTTAAESLAALGE